MSRNHRKNHNQSTYKEKIRQRQREIDNEIIRSARIVVGESKIARGLETNQGKNKFKLFPKTKSTTEQNDAIGLEIFGGFYFCVGDGENGKVSKS